MFPISMAPGPHSSISEGFLHSIFSGLRRILGSWNLVNPLLSMNEARMDECAARLQPPVNQYKPKQHQTFAIEKIRDLIVTRTKKFLLKKRDFLFRLDLLIESKNLKLSHPKTLEGLKMQKIVVNCKMPIPLWKTRRIPFLG